MKNHTTLTRLICFGPMEAPRSIVISLGALALLFILIMNWQLITRDLFHVNNDLPGHLIRGQFFLENPEYTDKWFNGLNVRLLYPPLGTVLESMLLIAFRNPSMALEASMLIAQFVLLTATLLLARSFKKDIFHALAAFLFILGSSIIIGRFFIVGRLMEFIALSLSIMFIALMRQYLINGSRKNWAFAFIVCTAALLTHIFSVLLLPFCVAIALLTTKFSNANVKKSAIIATCALVASSVFWLPFLESHYTANTSAEYRQGWSLGWLSYALQGWGLLVLLISAPLFVKTPRNPAVLLLASILILPAYAKLGIFPSSLPSDFEGLTLNGSYFLVDDSQRAAYSVLAYKGFKSSWGDQTQSLSPENSAAISELKRNDCSSLRRFASRTNSRYLIDSGRELDRCGFNLIYDKGLHVYDLAP